MALSSLVVQNVIDGRYTESGRFNGTNRELSETEIFCDDFKQRFGNNHFPPTESTSVPTNTTWSQVNRGSQGYSYVGKIDQVVAPLSKRIPQALSADQNVRSLNPLMEWEGSVEKIDQNGFTARLTNVLTGEELPTEEAVFSLSELNDVNRENLKIGAIFRWIIGLQRLPNGNRQRVSELYFRRLPAHTEKEIERSINEARAIVESIQWDDSPASR